MEHAQSHGLTSEAWQQLFRKVALADAGQEHGDSVLHEARAIELLPQPAQALEASEAAVPSQPDEASLLQ